MVLICIISVSCKSQSEFKKPYTYLRHVGDIEFDNKLDDPNFTPCFSDSLIFQYFNMSTGLQYEGEKIAIDSYFEKFYKPINSNQTGWIRIRFIVNCKGETGRFRVLQSDEDFIETTFDKKITTQLLNLTMALNRWKTINNNEGSPIDYYQYLTFKIYKGKITKILP